MMTGGTPISGKHHFQYPILSQWLRLLLSLFLDLEDMLHVVSFLPTSSIFVQREIHRNSCSTRAIDGYSTLLSAQDSKILLFQLPGPFGNLEPDTS